MGEEANKVNIKNLTKTCEEIKHSLFKLDEKHDLDQRALLKKLEDMNKVHDDFKQSINDIKSDIRIVVDDVNDLKQWKEKEVSPIIKRNEALLSNIKFSWTIASFLGGGLIITIIKKILEVVPK